MIKRGLIYAIAVAAVSLCSLAVAADARQGSGAGHFVLGEGTNHGLHWVSSIRAGTTSAETCVSISTERGKRIGELQQCAEVTASSPLLEIVPTGPPGVLRRTVVVGVFIPGARRLKVDLGGAGRRTIYLQGISSSKAKSIGIQPVAYWAKVFRGPFCLRRVSAYNAGGKKLSDSGVLRCR